MSEETRFTGKVPYALTKDDAAKLWSGNVDDVGKYAASYVNAGDPGSVAEAAATRVLIVLQARTANELSKATVRLAFYTKVLIAVGILQAIAVIAAAFIVR